MASSSSTIRSSYDVFLSFRGPDVRKNFVDHLYTALFQNGIHTYIDDEELSKGEEISPALVEAIEDSQIAIVVFSEDYASSTWCLDEVAKIMECKEQKHLEVFPLFYKVIPGEVRTPRKSYRESMDKHESKYGEDSEKVKRWKNALLKAGSLSGWHFTDDGYEAKLIQHIVQEISARLARRPLPVAKYPVGLDSRVQEVKTILNLWSKDDVLMVGLWGQGGIGKTSLAKAIHNAIFKQFEGSCFLEQVRENSESSNDLAALQDKLLSQLLLGTKFPVYSAAQGSSLIQDRLCNKKVLIVLDDVDSAGQINALAGNYQWFGNGSRIIITTRDNQLLISHGISRDRIYEVKALENDQALELFRKHAFLGNQKTEISSNLIKRVLYYANGLPLALEVMGSFLCDRGECEWKSTLEKLAKSPRKEINDVLKVSYDGLDPDEQEIFLDIACFFKGHKTKYIKKVLYSCGFQTTIGIKVLIERSLIRDVRGCLQMHDLLQLMGMDIVKQECRDDPGERSRLWLYDDVLDVLSGDAVKAKVKAIVLRSVEREEMYIGPNAFKKMRKLRLLILDGVDNSFQGPIHLPNELRWLEWPNCGWFPKFSAGPKKLVGLLMPESKIQEVPEQFKDFKKLKFVNFSESQLLVSMPVFDCTPNIEELDLHGCNNLEHLPDVSKDLQLLNLNNCSKLPRFPSTPGKIEFLRKVYLQGTSIEELHASIENLVSLEELDLTNCKKLAILPSSIYRLQNLEDLRLNNCSKLIKFPKKEDDLTDPYNKMGFHKLCHLGLKGCNLLEVEFLKNHSYFPSLLTLDLEGNNFTDFPTCEQLHKLYRLSVSRCKRLQDIGNIPGQLPELRAGGCESVSKISSSVCDLKRFCTKSDLEVLLPGGEMPEWLVPNNEGCISFIAPKFLNKKFLGLAICFVLQVKGPGEVELTVAADINSGCGNIRRVEIVESESDQVWLRCEIPWSTGEMYAYDPNLWDHFLCIIRAPRRATVKKCGFRLICKPLENGLKVFLQHNPLMDPALLYEVQHDHSQTSTVQETSNATEDLPESKTSAEEDSSSNLVLQGSNMANFALQRWLEHEDNRTNTEGGNPNKTKYVSRASEDMANFSIEKYRYSEIPLLYRNVRSREEMPEEMPEEFILVEDGTISFMASEDLYDNILGLTLCVVFDVEDGKREISFDIVPHVNDERRNVLSGTLDLFNSDHMWIQYLRSNVLWGFLEGGVDFDQFGERYLRFSLQLKILGGTMKKLGYVIRCKQLEDDLKVELEDRQLVNLASLCEDSEEPEDSWMDSVADWFFRREYLRKCHMHIEELEASDGETDQEPEDSSMNLRAFRSPYGWLFRREHLRKYHMYTEELEASDGETGQTESGECSTGTD